MTSGKKLKFSIFILIFCVSEIYCLMDGLYCGRDNCYDVLGVTRDSTKSEITKAYRKLARKWHPDMHKTQDAKDSAEEMFQRIAAAYEVLRDNESREDYDYMLDNPDEYYRHYYKYYSRRMAPKVDVRIVIVVTISVISAIQYWSAWSNYNTAISYLVTTPKYRMKVTEIAREQGLIDTKKKRDRTKTKEEIKKEEEEILKNILKERMDIRGGYSPPKVTDVLWLRIILLPYTIFKYLKWYVRWIWKFTINKEEYGPEEREYVIRKFLGVSQGQWDALEDHEKREYLKKELWVKENFVAWKREKEEEMKVKLAESAKYKSYRRYKKRGGPGQMTFGPE